MCERERERERERESERECNNRNCVYLRLDSLLITMFEAMPVLFAISFSREDRTKYLIELIRKSVLVFPFILPGVPTS